MMELNMTEPLPMWTLSYTFDLNYVIPLVGVIIGWLRHNLLGVKKVSDEVIRRLDMTPQDQPVFRNLLDSILPNLESLHKRYEKDVNVIASTEPLLGFRLRSKRLIGSSSSSTSLNCINKQGFVNCLVSNGEATYRTGRTSFWKTDPWTSTAS